MLTLNHDTLLHKLSYYGIGSTWYKSYLSDNTSESLYFEITVPQGSILGPFVAIYCVPTSLKYCCVNMYANDTALYTYGHHNFSESTHLLTSYLCDVRVHVL